MRAAVVGMAMVLAACGGKDDSDDSSTPTYDVSRISMTSATCFTFSSTCSIILRASYSDGSSAAPSGYDLVLSAAQGTAAPKVCDASSTTALAPTGHQYTELPLSTTYAVRACLFNRAAKTYSVGAETTFTTPAS